MLIAATQHEGHHRGRHAAGHISYFKRYDTVGELGAHLSAAPLPEDIVVNPPHSAMVAARARKAINLSAGVTPHSP